MDQLVRRITVVLVNESKHVVVELKESCRFAPRGIYSYEIELVPLSHRNIPATFFHRRAIDSSRPTAVKIFVDGVYSNVALTPRDFIRYFCIIVRVDENGEVRVGGIKATTWLDHLRRIGLIASQTRYLITIHSKKMETKAGEEEENKKRFEELRKICDKQEDRLQTLQATAFQLANYYFVFQGVILTATCSSATSLKCSDRWFLFTVSLLAALLNLVALMIKGLEYVRVIEEQDQNWSECNELHKIILQGKATTTDHGYQYAGNYNGLTKCIRYCTLAGCMVLFIGFAVVTLVGCWLIVCSKYDCGSENKKDKCIKFCQGPKCIRICNGS